MEEKTRQMILLEGCSQVRDLLYVFKVRTCLLIQTVELGEVGIPRMLKLFDKYNIKTTFFTPGHSLDTFPTEMAAVRDAGHEIGLHG